MHRVVAAGAGAGAAILVGLPALAWEEFGYGRPMIDDGTWDWLWPAVFVALAFLIGGWLASRWSSGWPPAGATAGALAAAALVAADVIRRLAITHQSLSWGVDALWVYAGVGGVVMSAAAAEAWRRSHDRSGLCVDESSGLGQQRV